MQHRRGKIAAACLMAAFFAALGLGCGNDSEQPPAATPTNTATPSPTASATPTETPTPLPTLAAGLTFYRNSKYPENFANPLPHIPYPQHPFLAPNGRNNMHDDAYMSDTYEGTGPMARDADVTLRSYAGLGNNLCVTITFDSRGRILTTNAELSRFRTLLIDPLTMDAVAQYLLPPRNTTDPLFPYNDTSGAAYFALDNQDGVMLADAANALQIIRYDDAAGSFEVLHQYDLTPYLVPLQQPARDHVQMTLPDWNREDLLWFMTRYGVIGTIDLNSNRVETVALAGEEIENSFAIAEDGAYFVTDHAMYRFHVDDHGVPVQDWRTQYDRGSRVKPGNINQGSGTTPKIFGDMVAIADNAEPRMNVLFLKRSDGSVVCQQPVFGDDLGTTENAMPGFVREGPNGLEYSLIVENNYGKQSPNLLSAGGACANSVGGVVRVDMVPDASGQYSCRQVWASPENSCSTVPKLSLGNGLLYLYTYERLVQGYGYYLTTVDFETGETVYRQPTGTGIRYADFGAPLTLSPTGDTVFVGTLGGLLRIRDRQ